MSQSLKELRRDETIRDIFVRIAKAQSAKPVWLGNLFAVFSLLQNLCGDKITLSKAFRDTCFDYLKWIIIFIAIAMHK